MLAAILTPSNPETIEDEYKRYCNEPLISPGESPLVYWKENSHRFPRLSQMAKDILSIPGMSAEVERLFSSAKFMLPPERSMLGADGIEAGECIRSWIKNKLFFLDSGDLNQLLGVLQIEVVDILK
jgi:hypothetical protein